MKWRVGDVPQIETSVALPEIREKKNRKYRSYFYTSHSVIRKKMPAAKEAAGGESARHPPPHPTPPFRRPQRDPVVRLGVRSTAPPSGIRPRQERVQITVSSPRTQLGASGHSQPLPTLPHPTGSVGHGRSGLRTEGTGPERRPPLQDPDNGIPGAPRPSPPDPERDRVGVGGRAPSCTGEGSGRGGGSQRPRVFSPPPASEGLSGQEPGRECDGGGPGPGGSGRRRRLPGPLPPSPR